MHTYTSLLFAASQPELFMSLFAPNSNTETFAAIASALAVITVAGVIAWLMVKGPRKETKWRTDRIRTEEEKWQEAKDKVKNLIAGKKFLIVLRNSGGTRSSAESHVIDIFTQLNAHIPIVNRTITNAIWENDFDNVKVIEDGSYILVITVIMRNEPSGEIFGYDMRLMIQDSGKTRAVGARFGKATSEAVLGKSIARKVADILATNTREVAISSTQY